MKKLTLVVLLVITGLYAQERDTIFLSDGDMLIKVYEKKFDFPVLDAVFDTAIVSLEKAINLGWKREYLEEKGKGDMVKILYPRLILVSRGRKLPWLPDERRDSYYAKDILFFSKNGEVIKRIGLKDYSEERVYFSPKKKYFVISRVPTEWNPSYRGGVLYNINGEKIIEIKKFSPIAVSDEGYMIAVPLTDEVPPSPGGDFYIYNKEGELVSKIENPLKEKTIPFFAEYSDDAQFALLGFVGPASPPTVFILVTKEGQILWKKEFTKGFYSNARGEIRILSYKGVGGIIQEGNLKGFFIDWAGKLKWLFTLPKTGYGSYILVGDEDKTYISSNYGYLWCLNIKKGEVIFRSQKKPYPRFSEMYEQNGYLIIKGHPNTIFIFDKTGELKTEYEYNSTIIFLSNYNGTLFIFDTQNKKIMGFYLKQGG